MGISKLARLVENFSRRLQIQERVGMEVADGSDEADRAQGIRLHH